MTFKLLLKDDTNSVDFLGTAYRLRDRGFDLWTPKKKQVWGGESVYSHGSQLVTSTFENRRLRMWFQVTGATRDELASNVSAIENLLEKARQRSIEQTGSRVEIQYQWDGSSGVTYFEVIDGELRWPNDVMSVEQVHQKDEKGNYIITDFYLVLVISPFGYPISPVSGSPTELAISNGNGSGQTGGLKVWNHDDAATGHDNWVEIDGSDFKGDFEAKVKLILEADSGEAEKTSKIYIGVRKGDLTFKHILEDADASGTFRPAAVDAAIADDGGSMTDETTAANNATPDDMTLLPSTPAVDDAYYFGFDLEFTELNLNISTVGAGSWTIVWEYWDGDSWELVTGISDGTSGFTVGAWNAVSWTLPSDWAKTTVNSQGPYYYIRARVSVYTSITTQPLGQQVLVEADVADPDYSSGGTYTEITFSDTDGEIDLLEWTLTAAQIEATQGPFRFFGRCHEGDHWDQNGSYAIAVKYGSDILFQSGWVKPIDTTTELLDFGTIYLPPWLVGTPTGLAGLNISIRAKRDVAGSTTIGFDYMALMPQDGGYRILEYRATGVAQFEETIDDGWEEVVYHVNTSSKKTGLPFGLMPRIVLRPGNDCKIFFLQEGTSKNCEITRQMDVQVFVVPTYNALV